MPQEISLLLPWLEGKGAPGTCCMAHLVFFCVTRRRKGMASLLDHVDSIGWHNWPTEVKIHGVQCTLVPSGCRGIEHIWIFSVTKGCQELSVLEAEQPLCLLKAYFPGSFWVWPAWIWKTNILFSFASVLNLCFCFIKLPLSQPMRVFSCFIPLLHSYWRLIEWLWWVPGVNPSHSQKKMDFQ